MGRRNSSNNVPSPRNGERSSIGDFHVDQAIIALNKTCHATIATMTEYKATREATLKMLFPDDTLAKLSQVRGMVEPNSKIEEYAIANAELSINFDGAFVPTITPATMRIHPDRAGPLMSYIASVRAIHRQFEEVKQVLRWLNRNATPGAIRYFWPTALQLCPQATAFTDLSHVPARFSQPPGIGARMQMLKDAATCVVGSLLLPDDATANSRRNMWLTFNSETVRVGETSETYATDKMIYNI